MHSVLSASYIDHSHLIANTELKAKKYREGNRMCRLTIIAVTVAA